jgi:hypothetical protein
MLMQTEEIYVYPDSYRSICFYHEVYNDHGNKQFRFSDYYIRNCDENFDVSPPAKEQKGAYRSAENSAENGGA